MYTWLPTFLIVLPLISLLFKVTSVITVPPVEGGRGIPSQSSPDGWARWLTSEHHHQLRLRRLLSLNTERQKAGFQKRGKYKPNWASISASDNMRKRATVAAQLEVTVALIFHVSLVLEGGRAILSLGVLSNLWLTCLLADLIALIISTRIWDLADMADE